MKEITMKNKEDKLQQLIDHFDIREVIEAYVHACDRADAAALAEVYFDDSWDDHGPFKCNGKQFAVDCTNSLIENWSMCGHLLGQSRIKVTGDSAGAETYLYSTLTREDGDRTMLDTFVGRYIDQFERVDGQWRIRNRRCICDWSGSSPLTEDFTKGRSLFIQGARSQDDLSYEVLGLKRGSSFIDRQ